MVLTKKETEASIFLTNLMKLQNFYWSLNALASFNELDILSDVTITREDILSNKHVTSEEEMLWSNLKLDLSEEEKQQLQIVCKKAHDFSRGMNCQPIIVATKSNFLLLRTHGRKMFLL